MLLKRIALVALVSFVAAAPAALASRSTSGSADIQTLDRGVLAQLNAIRVSHGLVPLKANAALAAAAYAHSTDMAANGYFTHNSLNGSPFWKRLTGYSSASRTGLWSVGENLLWSAPDVDPATALKLWMASPEHRANILTARWRDIGIAAVHVASAPGTYGGQPVTIITTEFGVRR